MNIKTMILGTMLVLTLAGCNTVEPTQEEIDPQSEVTVIASEPVEVEPVASIQDVATVQYEAAEAEYYEPVPPVPAADPNPTGRLQPEYIGVPITCDTFSSQESAQAFLDANLKSYVTLDPERDGVACGVPEPVEQPTEYRGGRLPMTADPQSIKPQTKPCYPSCQYEALLEMTPDEREAIGAVRDMKPFVPKG